MCVVQAVPFTRSVPGGSQNDGRGVGERTGSRYMSTNVNEQDIAHWTLAKVWASGHKNQGPREKARYFFKKHNKNKQNFLQVDCFHTRHSNPFSGVRCATPSQRGSSMAVCFRKKSAGSCLCCTVLYKNMRPWLGCSMHRLLPCQCPQHTWECCQARQQQTEMWNFRQQGCDCGHTIPSALHFCLLKHTSSYINNTLHFHMSRKAQMMTGMQQ